jgi:hypothetical protein
MVVGDLVAPGLYGMIEERPGMLRADRNADLS